MYTTILQNLNSITDQDEKGESFSENQQSFWSGLKLVGRVRGGIWEAWWNTRKIYLFSRQSDEGHMWTDKQGSQSWNQL